MLPNNITNQNLIEQILQNSNKKINQTDNVHLKKQLFNIIDAMFKESATLDCFC